MITVPDKPVAPVPGQVPFDDAFEGASPVVEGAPAPAVFTEVSLAKLRACAVPHDQAEDLGIRPVRAPHDLPEELQWAWDGPGMVIEWRDHSGTVPQYRPDTPLKVYDGEREPRKYLFPKGAGSPLNWLREPAEGTPVLIVEGALKGPSVAAWAPEGYGVAAIIGCRGWMGADLTWAEDRSVLVAFDADTATNLDVWQAGTKLREALLDEGATEVRFLRPNTARAKDGIDDVLGARPAGKRESYLQRLIDRSTDKLGTRPAAKKTSGKPGPDMDQVRQIKAEAEEEGRKPVAVNRDVLAVITDLVDGMKSRDGESLFNHGGALSEYSPDEHAMKQVDEGRFRMVLAETSKTVRLEKDGSLTPAWPDSNTMKATFSNADKFSKVRRIMRAPFVRADGSVCTTPGYDRVSQTYADFPTDLAVSVPDSPTAQQIEDALSLILMDWWADFPFPEESDRTNALAMLLTPFVRDSVNVVPLAIVNGLVMGSAKNLLADVCSLVFSGATSQLDSLSEDDEEMRKVVTAMLRGAPSVVVFDEAHVIGGKSLAKLLTAETWGDRVLGVSNRVALPNVATWIALGNKVQVDGDMQRRYYFIRLHPTVADPHNRPADDFLHPDLKAWTTEHRAELLTAVLTLIRAWYAQGRPYEPGFSFGSFERWQRTVGGILQVAGRRDFLGGLQEARSDSDVVGSHWDEHMDWLAQYFGTGEFRAADVKAQAQRDLANYLPPPGLKYEISDQNYARDLGYAYRKAEGRVRNGSRLMKTGVGHNNVAKYALRIYTPTKHARYGGDGGTGGTSTPNTVAENVPLFEDASARTHTSPRGAGRISSPPSPPIAPKGLVHPDSPGCTCGEGIAPGAPCAARVARQIAAAATETPPGTPYDCTYCGFSITPTAGHSYKCQRPV